MSEILLGARNGRGLKMNERMEGDRHVREK